MPTPKARRTPWLASDAKRGWFAAGISMVLVLIIPFALVWLGADVDRQTIIAADLFIFWTLLSVLTVALTAGVYGRADSATLRRWLTDTEPPPRTAWVWNILNGGGNTGWAVTGAIIAVIAVLVLSFLPEYRASATVVYSGIAVVVSSLGLVIVSYAVRYARQDAAHGGFSFAGGEAPRFADYVYLAIQVSTTFSTSDVTIERSAARRVVSVHSLIAFAFNTIIVALLVSVLVSVATTGSGAS
jgi:hypothetical protein